MRLNLSLDAGCDPLGVDSPVEKRRPLASSGTLPELRRRAEDHCGDPGSAGDRENPHAPGIAGACTASGAGRWPGAASGLTLPNLDGSCDLAPRAAGFGCVRGFAGPMEAGWRPGITRRRRLRRTIFGGAVNAQQTCQRPTDRGRLRRQIQARQVPCSAVFGVPWGRKNGV